MPMLEVEFPIYEKELRARLHKWRAPVYLVIVLLPIVMTVAYLFITHLFQLHNQVMAAQKMPLNHSWFLMSAGVNNLARVFVLLLVIIYSARAIAAEREHHTLETLFNTPLSTVNIVAGKLLSALAYVPLMAWCSLTLNPLAWFRWIMPEGESAVEYFALSQASLVQYIAYAIFLAAIGIYCSTFFRRGAAAIATVIGILLIATGNIGSIVQVVFSPGSLFYGGMSPRFGGFWGGSGSLGFWVLLVIGVAALVVLLAGRFMVTPPSNSFILLLWIVLLPTLGIILGITMSSINYSWSDDTLAVMISCGIAIALIVMLISLLRRLLPMQGVPRYLPAVLLGIAGFTIASLVYATPQLRPEDAIPYSCLLYLLLVPIALALAVGLGIALRQSIDLTLRQLPRVPSSWTAPAVQKGILITLILAFALNFAIAGLAKIAGDGRYCWPYSPSSYPQSDPVNLTPMLLCCAGIFFLLTVQRVNLLRRREESV